jgi:hypothetical protein
LRQFERCKFAYPNAELFELNYATEFASNSCLIEEFITDRIVKAGRPLKILMDVTCMPKSYILFLIGLGFSRGLTARFDCMYAERDYVNLEYGTDRNTEELGFISEGIWSSLQIPYLGADNPIPRKRDLFVSMGGEIALSVSFLEKYEPERLGLGVVKEGLVDSQDHRRLSEEAALQDILAEPNVIESRIGVSDAVGLVRVMWEFVRVATADTVIALALGSKPHEIALGIVAMSFRNCEVICRIPKVYYPIDVPPTGRVALYPARTSKIWFPVEANDRATSVSDTPVV